MIMILGEAWDREEEEQGAPFVGASGKFLRAMLAAAGVSYADAYATNVFNFRPKPTNDVKNLCGGKRDGIPGFPPLMKSKYVLAKYAGELDRLYTEIANVKPTLIIALGATAAWSVLGTTGIRGLRGTTYSSVRGVSGIKVLPTYHPAAVLREYTLHPILFADLQKAARESLFPDVRRPQRQVWVEPTFEDLLTFEREHILPSPDLSIDIETVGNQITMIGFAPTKSIALVVPFISKGYPGNNYWRTLQEELEVWAWVKRVCELKKKIVGQNFLYDLKFLWGQYGIPVPHATDDTMLLHHALQPEMEKGLAFLGSVYTDEASWKLRRKENEKKGLR